MRRVRIFKRFFCDIECSRLRPETPPCVQDLVETIKFDPVAFVEGYMKMFDRLAGPYALSPEEWDLQHLCRVQFGFYQPNAAEQIAFVQRLHLLTKASEPQRDDSRVIKKSVEVAEVVDMRPNSKFDGDALWVAFLDQVAA